MAEGILLHDAPLAVIEVDAALRVAGWNRRAEQIFGVSQADALGRGLDALLPVVGEGNGWSWLLTGDGGGAPRVWPIRTDGAALQFEAWSMATRDAAGHPIGAALIGHDATDRLLGARNELELRGKVELIERQQAVIRELSTPIIEVWDGVLTLPIVGLVDSVRTADIMDELLSTVTRIRARYAILDLTGVEVVDTGTAAHLIGMIQAIRLLGAEGILTGIHPSIAQTIVALDVDLSRVAVFAKLRDALKHCIVQMGKQRSRQPGR